jgi:hypothetical protein
MMKPALRQNFSQRAAAARVVDVGVTTIVALDVAVDAMNVVVVDVMSVAAASLDRIDRARNARSRQNDPSPSAFVLRGLTGPQRSPNSPVVSFTSASLAPTITFENIEEITHDRR